MGEKTFTYGSVCSGIEAKACAVCKAEKPLEAFHRQGERGRHSYCRECYNAKYRGARRRAVDAVARRSQNMKSRYGLDAAAYEALLASQGGKCAICSEPPARPVVDHDHLTGAVRGILCHGCNIKLPAVEDEAYRRAAIRYLGGAA